MKKHSIILIIFFSLVSCMTELFPPLIITGKVSNIDKDGALFHANVTDLGNKVILEYGFVWDTIPKPKIETAERYNILSPAKVGSYEAKISTSLIKSKTYYVRAFIRNADITCYGEETSFVSQGGKLPEINSISPLIANLNDTLKIVGKYFSTRSSEVKINQLKAQIIKSNQDTIYIRIPTSLAKKTSSVSLTNLNQTIVAKDSFTLISPEISALENNKGTWGDEFTIKGRNFLKSPTTIKIYVDKEPTSGRIIDDQTIKAIVPEKLINQNSIIGVVMNNLTAQSVDKYSLFPTEITDVSPQTAVTGSTITISGKNFSPIAVNNMIYVGGVRTTPVSVTKNTLQVILPTQEAVIYESRNATVTVKMGTDYSQSLAAKLTINDKWFRLADAPVRLYFQNSFVVNKTAYIGLNNTKSFWAYKTETNTWKKLADFPGDSRTSNAGFVYQDKIYFGTGTGAMITYNNYVNYNDWWEYNTQTDTWQQKNNCPVTPGGGIKGFNTNDGCFLTDGYTYTYNGLNSFTYHINAKQYNPLNDSWSNVEIGSLLYENGGGVNFWTPYKAVSNGNEVYVHMGLTNEYRNDRMYIINTSNKTIQHIADYPSYTYERISSFCLNGIVYIKRMDPSEYEKTSLYYYDKATDKWKFADFSIYSEIQGGYGSFSFEVGGIGYIGHTYNNNKTYEFDPSR